MMPERQPGASPSRKTSLLQNDISAPLTGLNCSITEVESSIRNLIADGLFRLDSKGNLVPALKPRESDADYLRRSQQVTARRDPVGAVVWMLTVFIDSDPSLSLSDQEVAEYLDLDLPTAKEALAGALALGYFRREPDNSPPNSPQ